LESIDKLPTTRIDQNATPAKVLIAEDNTLNQKLMAMMFDKLDVKVDIVSNGQEAVTAALANSYDVVLMDIQMPVMNGIEACEAIKKATVGKSPVIVALTANSLDGDREKFLESGMDDYLPKPLSLEDIRKTLNEYSS
jgi:CheY-like chemotaxis protein